MLWQEWCPLTTNFVITNMRQHWSRKVLENHPFTPTFHQHLTSSWFFDGVHVAHLFSFLCCVSCFPCPSTVYCAQCCLCHSISHFWLHLRFSLAFIYKYTFQVIPKHYLWHILLWLGYKFVQIMLKDTHRKNKLGRLLKALSSITDMLLYSNRL